ncbi:MAG: hypothetical protein ACQ5SW_01040, partial [Sphaerochaetaceae bacterium]
NVCVVLTTEGSELLVTTYRRREASGQGDELGFLPIHDSAVTDIIRSEQGAFTLFMPHEPFALGIQDEAGSSVSKHLFILLDSV